MHLRKRLILTAVYVCTAQLSEAGGVSLQGTAKQTGASEGKNSCSVLHDGAETYVLNTKVDAAHVACAFNGFSGMFPS